MGLGNFKSRTYVTIVGSKFTIRTGAEDIDGTKRETKNGKTIYEKYYQYLQGNLVKSEIHSSDYGKFLNLTIKSKGDEYIMQLPLNSQYFGQFMKVTPNIKDYNIPLFIGIGYDNKKEKGFLYVKQNNSTIHSYYTKEHPNGLPAPVKETVQGEQKWNFKKQEEYLYNLAVKFCEKVDKEMQYSPDDTQEEIPNDTQKETQNLFDDKKEDDDLPF